MCQVEPYYFPELRIPIDCLLKFKKLIEIGLKIREICHRYSLHHMPTHASNAAVSDWPAKWRPAATVIMGNPYYGTFLFLITKKLQNS
jgi:hypothetical protein